MAITDSEQFREIERLCSKGLHDEARALHHARQEGRQEGISKHNIEIAKAMIADGKSAEKSCGTQDWAKKELETLTGYSSATAKRANRAPQQSGVHIAFVL